MLSKDEKEYLLHLLDKQLEQIKDFEKQPDDYFESFAQEVSVHEFLNNLIEKIKNW